MLVPLDLMGNYAAINTLAYLDTGALTITGSLLVFVVGEQNLRAASTIVVSS